MATNIFYSWQSDLSNNTNRSFIEDCIQKAIKQLKQIETFSVDACLDRDTKNEPGTPDIANTIFKKIEEAKVFIADVSIINHNSKERRTPNPNVLIELGYAAKVLGWEKIICIYNEDYGNYEDLPFDLRFRRPLPYSLEKKHKPTEKSKVAKAIINTIINLHKKGLLLDDIDDYLRVQVDTQILTIIGHFRKLLYDYGSSNSFEGIKQFLDLNVQKISECLSNKQFLGFQVFKKFEYSENELKIVLDKATASSYSKRELIIPIIDLIKWIGSFDKFNKPRTTPDLFLKCGDIQEGYKIENMLNAHPSNIKYPERYILLKILSDEKAMVQDFGDFQEKDKVDGLAYNYKMNKKYIVGYSHYVYDFISIVHRWLDVTGGEFIIDDTKAFEIRPSK